MCVERTSQQRAAYGTGRWLKTQPARFTGRKSLGFLEQSRRLLPQSGQIRRVALKPASKEVPVVFRNFVLGLSLVLGCTSALGQKGPAVLEMNAEGEVQIAPDGSVS